ncbi:hypothetical protein ACWEU6_22990 [Streptosporangium sandarakinum]
MTSHDDRTGRAMWDRRSPQYEAEFNSAGSFINWTSLTDVEVGEPKAESCRDIRRCARVPVSYTFEQCEFYTTEIGP